MSPNVRIYKKRKLQVTEKTTPKRQKRPHRKSEQSPSRRQRVYGLASEADYLVMEGRIFRPILDIFQTRQHGTRKGLPHKESSASSANEIVSCTSVWRVKNGFVWPLLRLSLDLA